MCRSFDSLTSFPLPGWATFDFYINDAPTAGECDVIPSSGNATSTLFNVDCTTPFSDDEEPLTYKVGYRRSVSSSVIWLYSGARRALLPRSLTIGESITMPISIIA